MLFLELPAQTILNWSDMEKGISWKEREVKTLFPSFLEADFSDKLTELEGKVVTITGFLLVLDGNQTIYMLSKNPMASCFFCGNGGPETILEVSFERKNSFEMDDLITLTGVLGLNREDSTRCYYRIEQAEGFEL